ncbi:MAG: hypothetical protein GEV09_19395 [Pseudonocardiaceae bacterium]|nr:hypothetical protein [Pseudonocardiaceae bacterium]
MVGERQRLAAELHDTLTQGFTSIVMQLEAAHASLRANRPKVSRDIDAALATARDSLAEIRRLVWALRPEALERESLVEALRSLVWRLDGPVRTRTVVTGEARPLPTEVETTVLRAAQEGLANVRRHAAACEVTVTLSYMDDLVALDIRDDGDGFDPDGVATGPHGGLGLVAMRERALALGGAMDVESAPGEGTSVALRLPVHRPVGGPEPAGVGALAR